MNLITPYGRYDRAAIVERAKMIQLAMTGRTKARIVAKAKREHRAQPAAVAGTWNAALRRAWDEATAQAKMLRDSR